MLPCGSRPRLSEARGSGDKLDATTTALGFTTGTYIFLRLAPVKVRLCGAGTPAGVAPLRWCRQGGQERPLPHHMIRLFHFYGCASLGELLLYSLGLFLGNALFHVLGRSVDQFLGFFQAQAGDFADGLDYIDLIGADFLENDGEFGLLFGRSRTAAAAAPPPPLPSREPRPQPRRRDAIRVF